MTYIYDKRTGLTILRSGIFGYINYLVEKDRKYILDTLVNGMHGSEPSSRASLDADDIRLVTPGIPWI